jgi:CheY-like chemotaxis protein
MPGIALIIDNDGGMRQIIERILVPQGYTVIHAEDGAQGLEKFQRNEPSVVLLDIRLSDIDAPEMLDRLRKIRPDVPIVLMSGLADAETAQGLVKKGTTGSGAVTNISKPFKVDSLLSLLEGIVGGKAIPAKGQPSPATDKPKAKEEPRKNPSETAKSSVAKHRFGLIIAASIALILTAGIFSYMYFFSGGSKQFRIISDSPSALYVGGGSAYIADWMAEAIYKYDLKDFTTQDKYKVPGMQASGLAYDGKYFWAAHSLEGTIHKLALEPRPSSVAVFVSTGPNPSGLFFDGKNLWVADSQTNKIYKYLTDDKLTLVNTFESPARSPRAVFGVKDKLYIIEGATNRIYLVRTTDFMVEGVFALPGFEDAKKHLVAAYLNGKYLWVCADGEAVVWQFVLKDLKPVKM